MSIGMMPSIAKINIPRATLQAMSAKNMTLDQMAAELNTERRTIANRMREYGLTRQSQTGLLSQLIGRVRSFT